MYPELTARINDDGWEIFFLQIVLKGSNL